MNHSVQQLAIMKTDTQPRRARDKNTPTSCCLAMSMEFMSATRL